MVFLYENDTRKYEEKLIYWVLSTVHSNAKMFQLLACWLVAWTVGLVWLA